MLVVVGPLVRGAVERREPGRHLAVPSRTELELPSDLNLGPSWPMAEPK